MKKVTVLSVLMALLPLMFPSCTETRKAVPDSHDEKMEWWRDAGFGMFVH